MKLNSKSIKALTKSAIALTAMSLLSATVQARPYNDHSNNARTAKARVVTSQPIFESSVERSEKCIVSIEEYHEPARNNHTGTLLGAVAGGVLGNQVGKGSGRAAATGIGVVVGAATGNHLGNQNAQGSWNQREVRKCVPVEEVKRVLTGYDVTYEYGGSNYNAVFPFEPGRFVDVEVSVTPVIR